MPPATSQGFAMGLSRSFFTSPHWKDHTSKVFRDLGQTCEYLSIFFQSQIARPIKRRINGRIQNLGQARGPAFSTSSGNTCRNLLKISRDFRCHSCSAEESSDIFSMERYGKALRVQQSTSRCFDIQLSIPSIPSNPPSRPGSRKGSP